MPEVLNFSENCIKSETMLAHLAQQQVYVSSASACGRGQPSHTLAAMGRDPLAIDTAIRVSFCADNTPEDVDAFLKRLRGRNEALTENQKVKKESILTLSGRSASSSPKGGALDKTGNFAWNAKAPTLGEVAARQR